MTVALGAGLSEPTTTDVSSRVRPDASVGPTPPAPTCAPTPSPPTCWPDAGRQYDRRFSAARPDITRKRSFAHLNSDVGESYVARYGARGTMDVPPVTAGRDEPQCPLPCSGILLAMPTARSPIRCGSNPVCFRRAQTVGYLPAGTTPDPAHDATTGRNADPYGPGGCRPDVDATRQACRAAASVPRSPQLPILFRSAR